ncbi:MAG: DNA gyrase inhibitor YacG [Burkholderiaceae bacterium]|nr:DNA gyrase inhibitor YacG [Pseudomonadota bacterium]MBS0596298.1 DNA gyrase inhibitor YacG [Pseudomonadota bacterium]MCO5116326.1 DNA gyrase inhibitor YacG [Burkholderiaceae bacterium]MCP5217826.1 DNA gyrase inhibitor YacG [Burkholderiaceae bacterium]
MSNDLTPRATTVRCPACGGPSRYAADNPWRPFCSARCKLHDLGDWANERFRVPAQDDTPDDATPPPAN